MDTFWEIAHDDNELLWCFVIQLNEDSDSETLDQQIDGNTAAPYNPSTQL